MECDFLDIFWCIIFPKRGRTLSVDFSPHFPWGTRHHAPENSGQSFVFQSTRPVEDATGAARVDVFHMAVSIHASRGGRDIPARIYLRNQVSVSILASLGDATFIRGMFRWNMQSFQSTRPVGNATFPAFRQASSFPGFNPRAPWRTRQAVYGQTDRVGLFQSTRPGGTRQYVRMNFV